MRVSTNAEFNIKLDKRITDLEDIKKVFDSFNVPFFLVYGALLGHYRDEKFIEHDDDIDLAVVESVSLETRKRIGHMLSDIGFVKQPIQFNVFSRMEDSEEGYNGDAETGIIVCERNFKFTIFFFKEEPCEKHGDEYVCTPRVGAMKLISTPKKFYDKPAEIKINNKKYLCPSPIEDYLQYSYNDWRDRSGRDHSPTFNLAHA